MFAGGCVDRHSVHAGCDVLRCCVNVRDAVRCDRAIKDRGQRAVGEVITKRFELDLGSIEQDFRCADQATRGVDDPDVFKGCRRSCDLLPSAKGAKERDGAGKQGGGALVVWPLRCDEGDASSEAVGEERRREPRRAAAGDNYLKMPGITRQGRSPASARADDAATRCRAL